MGNQVINTRLGNSTIHVFQLVKTNLLPSQFSATIVNFVIYFGVYLGGVYFGSGFPAPISNRVSSFRVTLCRYFRRIFAKTNLSESLQVAWSCGRFKYGVTYTEVCNCSKRPKLIKLF